MKYLIFFLTLFSINIISAQSWSYESGGNVFDGKYKTASVQGRGTDSPYYKPLLVINLFNENSLNFYVSSAGYFSQSSDVEILWIFNNEPDIIYTTDDYSISKDGKIIFFSSFKNTITGDKLFKLEYFEKLKSAGKVDVRIKNDYGKNDIVFSLSGSTKALDYVISKKYKDKIKADEDRIEALLLEYRENEREIAEKKREIAEKEIASNLRISKLLLEAEVLENELEGILDRIDYHFDYLNKNDIVSLNFDITYDSIDLNLFDSNKKLLKTLSSLDGYMPISYLKMKDKFESEREKRIEAFFQKVPDYFNHFDLSIEQKNMLVDFLRNSQELHNLNVSNIDSISITKGNSFSENYSKIHYWKEGSETTHSYERVPKDIMEIIENEMKENCSNIISGFIKEYELTSEENKQVVDSALEMIKTYFDYDMRLISHIDLVLFNKDSNDVEIRITETDGLIKKSKLYNQIGIAKKINKF